MKEQTLAEITDELVQAGHFLKEFTGERLECIQSFCKCQNIVEWIRKTTKGVCDEEPEEFLGWCLLCRCE